MAAVRSGLLQSLKPQHQLRRPRLFKLLLRTSQPAVILNAKCKGLGYIRFKSSNDSLTPCMPDSLCIMCPEWEGRACPELPRKRAVYSATCHTASRSYHLVVIAWFTACTPVRRNVESVGPEKFQFTNHKIKLRGDASSTRPSPVLREYLSSTIFCRPQCLTGCISATY